MSKNALIRRAREAKSWLMDACFPLWAEAGVEDGVFAERLDLQHRPDPSDETRVRVQARQTYVFCQAQRLGWRTERSRKLIDLGVSVLDGASRRPDGLMGRVLDRSTAQLLDPTADLYDTAFALFAFSHAAHRRDGSGRALAAAGRTVKALSAIEDPAGGYAEGIPRPANRLQNPHMHLLEAYLAFQAVAPGEVRRNRVRSLRDLGLQRFFEAAQSDAILEVFDRDWTPIDDTIEPGHQFEWCRLLGMTAEVLSESSSSEIAAVYAAGLRGLDAEG
ncbi:MAG: AGE family epimerase/isomerase, partial [Pseudomonadota bacterium]